MTSRDDTLKGLKFIQDDLPKRFGHQAGVPDLHLV